MAAKRSGKTKEGFEKLEKRLVDALLRMFNGSESFYFSYEGDLTNSLQRNIQNKIYDASPWEKVLSCTIDKDLYGRNSL